MPDAGGRASFTGWGRPDWVALLAQLTDGFVRSIPPGGSPAGAQLRGAAVDDQVPSIEGFARMSVAWASWLHEPTNPDTLVHGDRRHDVAALLARGLADATNPRHPAWWGDIADRDQRIVEAAEIATALWLGGARLRGALESQDGDAYDRVLDWLALVDGRAIWDDNWVLFPMMSALARRWAGRPVADGPIDDAIDWMAAHHVGDGWYSDGAGHALDLYTGWAIHWHLLWWASIDGRRRPRLRATIVRRARAWLAGVAPAVATDGSFPLLGRSLGYRFAIAAPFAQAALLGHDPLPAGVSRRLASGLVKHSVAAGAIDPATDWLRVGVGGEKPAVVERYVSPGAAAWAAHAFVALAMPPAHPFWAVPEAALPADGGRSGSIAAARAGLLVSWTAGSGETRIHNARSGHPSDIPGHDYAATYGKLVYRSAFPFDVPIGSGGSPGSDGALVAIDGATAVGHRNETDAGSAGPGWAIAAYRLPSEPAPTAVTTAVLVLDDAEIRVSLVRSPAAVRIREGSAALPVDPHDSDRVPPSAADAGRPVVLASGGRAVAIRALAGYDRTGLERTSDRVANLVHDCAVHAFVEEAAPRTGARLLAAADLATTQPIDAVAVLAAIDGIQTGPAELRVEAPDVVAFVALGRRPSRSVELAGHRIHGPRLRLVRATPDGSSIAGEQIDRIDGVLALERSGIVAVSRIADGVELTLETGVRLDSAWAGARLDTVDVAVGAFGWESAGRLQEPGVVPDALVRRLRRAAGTRLVSIRVLAG